MSGQTLELQESREYSSFSEQAPYENCLANEQQENIRRGLEKWLLDSNLVSLGELNEMRRRKPSLTESEWVVIRDTPGDYWPVLFAKRMTPEQQNRFLGLGYADSKEFFHYNRMQMAWIGEAMRFFFEDKGRLPNEREENAIVNSLGGEFRVFYNLKTKVLGERVDYQDADKMISFKHKVASKNYSNLTFIPG